MKPQPHLPLPPPLEDNFTDVLKKALVGLGLATNMVSQRTGIPEDRVRSVLRGEVDASSLMKLAELAALNGEALVALAGNAIHPPQTSSARVITVTMPFRSTSVNAYILHDSSGSAWIFDAGLESSAIEQACDSRSLKPQAVFLTHGHPDHVGGAPTLSRRYKIPTYGWRAAEATDPVKPGTRLHCNFYQVEARQSTGHAADGLSFVIQGADWPLVFTGDALFAGSMGGGLVSYQEALRTTRDALFGLPNETLVFPGHGPHTTIGHERRWNPFFPVNPNPAT